MIDNVINFYNIPILILVIGTIYNSIKIRVLENFNGYGFRVSLNNCKSSPIISVCFTQRSLICGCKLKV